MTARVGVEFDGRANGVVTAGKRAEGAIRGVRQEAAGASPSLRNLESDLGKLNRGALAGSGIFRGLGRSVAFASAGFLGGFGLAAAVRGAADELKNQVVVNAQVRAALRSTGAVSGETAKSINELAQAELRKTGIDDEVIKSAEAMLLRFTQVRDVAGEGNDIFKRATQTSLDLSKALGRDATDAAFALGKALNDPTRGVQQLRRVGAAFTAEEAKQIKQMAEHGHVLEAQKLILDALAKSYGGTAAAVANVTPWSRLRETIKNLSATAIRPLLPEMDGLVGRAQKWADHLAKDSKAQQQLKSDIVGTVNVAKDFAHGADRVAGALGGWKQTLEVLLALKVATTLSGWSTALRVFIGSEAALSGVEGAAASTGLLNKRLAILRGLASKPIQVVIAYEIIRKLTHSNADLSNNAGGPGEMLPVYRNGKWVDPITGQAVADQAYWNNQFKRNGGTGKPLEGQQSAGIVVKSGAPPTSYANRVRAQTNGLSALQAALPGAKGSNAIDYPGHAKKSYHYSGEALDIGDGGNPASLISDWNYLYPLRQNFAELIWNPPANVRAQAPGSGAGYFWGVPGNFSDHTDHIHVAFTGTPEDVGKLKAAVERGKKQQQQRKGAAPPTSSGGGTGGSTNPLPSRLRQSISAADVAAAAAALTPGKADDKAAIRQQRAALDDEIAWLRAKLKTNLGAEKRITLEDLLTGALGDLQGLQPGKKTGGTGISAVTSLRNTVTQDLKGLPSTLDDVERNAVTHLEKLRAALHTGMSAKDLADTRVGIQNWGKVLKTEISKQAKAASAAATAAANLWQRTWVNDVNRVLRDFQENVAQTQLQAFDDATTAHLKELRDQLKGELDAFDTETKRGLAALDAPAQTAEERALAEFQAQRKANDELDRKQQILQQIADLQAETAAAGSSGTLIDIATGQRSAIPGELADVKDNAKQILDLQKQYHELELDDQEQALSAAADASRKAADVAASDAQARYQADRDAARSALEDKESDAEDSYQRLRDGQRQALQDRLDDQATALQQDLDDWNTWLTSKAKSWTDFLTWLHNHGVDTVLDNPGGSGGSATIPGVDDSSFRVGSRFVPGGKAVAFAGGGRVPGRFVGRQDTVLARLTPGETVIDRNLTRALEVAIAAGGLGAAKVAAGDVYIDGRRVGTVIAQPVDAEQRRIIGYTSQRG